MPEADVRLDRVTKRFGDVVAVDDLTLAIPPGEFFSLLGPSGCGKTTTLRMIGGFEEVTEGKIYLGDTDVTDLPPFKRATNTVFQSYALFPHLNVFENIAFGLRRRGTPTNEIRHQVAFMLKLVELPGFEERRPSQLSGGQQQRVALARALVNNPQVLLLDEPLGALDLKLRKQMQIELKRIQSEIGITFIFVTHDQEEAMTMSDRIAVMRAGRIEQLGTPEELYERPATEFVAGFLGVSNLLDAEVAARGERFADLRLADGTMLRAPSAALERRDEGPPRRAPREAARARHRRGRLGGSQRRRDERDRGRGARRVLHRGEHAVPRRDAGQASPRRLRPEPRDQRRERGAGRRPARSPHLEAAAHLRHRAARRPAPDATGRKERSSSPMRDESSIERAIARAFRPDARMSRRSFLRGTGRGAVIAGSALTLPSILAACGINPASRAPEPARGDRCRRARSSGRTGRSTSTSTDDGNYPSIVAFTDQTGIEVNYTEAIQDNADFMGTILPDLQAGNPTGWDVISPAAGWSSASGGSGSSRSSTTASCRTGRRTRRTMPRTCGTTRRTATALWWQGGITGLAYDPELTGREITTFDDLLDPAFAQRAGGFSDMRDMFGLTLLSLGVEPANATVDDVTRAQQKLLEANERGHFRGYYGNEYYDALAAGDLAVSVAWSGDVGQMQLYDNPNVQFVIPEDGAMRWNDTLAIPKGAARIGRRARAAELLVRPGRRDAGLGVHRLLHRRQRRPGPDPGRCGDRARRGRHRDGRPARGPGADGRPDRGAARQHVHRQAAHRGGGGAVERPLPGGDRRLT